MGDKKVIKISVDVKELLEVSKDEEELEKEYLEYYCIDNEIISWFQALRMVLKNIRYKFVVLNLKVKTSLRTQINAQIKTKRK